MVCKELSIVDKIECAIGRGGRLGFFCRYKLSDIDAKIICLGEVCQCTYYDENLYLPA